MKKRLLLIAALSSSMLLGQGITLGSADFADGGDTLRLSSATDNNYDYLTTGEGVTWDFSALTANSQRINYFAPMSEASPFVFFDFGFFAPSEYQATYFTAANNLPIGQVTQILPVSIEEIYQYSKKASTGITNLGYSMKLSANGASFDLSVPSDTIETYYALSMNYGDTNVTRGYTNIDMNPFINAIWNQHIRRVTVVDGYGSLITPYGTFNVLRLKHEIAETDSIQTELPILGLTWIPLELPLRREYEWWANGEKVPLLKITTNEVLADEAVTSIEYRENYLGLDVGLEELGWETEIFPVPANDIIMLKSAKALNSVQVCDDLGRLVKSELMTGSTYAVLEITDLKPGVYTLMLFTEDSRSIKKFIKQ